MHTPNSTVLTSLTFFVDSNGRSWPMIAGGADDAPPADPPADPPGDDDAAPADPPADPPAADDKLGEPGKKALQAEREARKVAEKAAKDAQSELDKIKRNAMSEQERAIAEARDAASAETAKQFTDRIVNAEIRAAAGGKAKDPNDVLALIDRNDLVADDGTVKTEAISERVSKLIETKPYLASGATPGPGAGPTGGTQPPPGSGKASSLDSAVAARYQKE